MMIKENNEAKVVVIGGGTGLSTMLRGLKQYTSHITAIVTVGDDGGGSGKLREDLGMLPPGDIRNCILALADNFEDAVQKMSSVLAVKGKVLPVTLDDMKLVAELENGEIIEGESKIPSEVIVRKTRIKKIAIKPIDAKPLEEAIKAINNADVIIMGPGSLYTSIIPNLLVKGIPEAICKSPAKKVYISNVMTQPGETDGFKVSNHLKVLMDYGVAENIDYVIANNGIIPPDIKEKYAKENAELVVLDYENISNLNVNVIEADLIKITKRYVKHNAEKLAELIMKNI